MKALKISIAILLILILVLSASFLFSKNFSFMGNFVSASEISNSHLFTKAICNEENFCEDYFINCSGKNLLDMKSTGYAVQFSSDWKDPRNSEDINRTC